MANLKTFRFSAEELASMRSTLERDSLSERSRVHFLFALAEASEDAGDFDEAWTLYSAGNSLQRSLEHYVPVQTEIANQELREVFTAELLAEKAGLGNPDPAPIFIVGLNLCHFGCISNELLVGLNFVLTELFFSNKQNIVGSQQRVKGFIFIALKEDFE